MQTPGRAVEPQTPMVPLERRMDSAYERLLTRAQESAVTERSQIRGLGRVILEMEQLNNNMKSIQSEIRRDIRARARYFKEEQKLLKKDIQQQQGFQTAALFDLRKTIGLASFGIAANELAQGDIGGAAQGIGLGITSFLPEIAQGVIGILAARGLIGGFGRAAGGMRAGGMLAGGLGMLGGGKGKAILALASLGGLLLTGGALAGGRADNKRNQTIQIAKQDSIINESDVDRFSNQLTRFKSTLVDIDQTREKTKESTVLQNPDDIGSGELGSMLSGIKSSRQDSSPSTVDPNPKKSTVIRTVTPTPESVTPNPKKSTVIPTPESVTPKNDIMGGSVTDDDVKQEMGRLGMNKGGQVPGSGNTDTVPAMLTPGEVVMSKSAVDKIGADKLLAMNAAGGGTNQPEIGYRIGQVNPDTIVSSSEVFTEKTTDSTKKGGILGKVFDRDFESFKEKDLSKGGPGLSMQTIEKFKKDGLRGESVLTEDIASVGLPDIMEHQEDLMKRINAIEGFEEKTIEDVINRTVGMNAQQYTRLLNSSDAARATEKKRELARQLDQKAGITHIDQTSYKFAGGGLVGGNSVGTKKLEPSVERESSGGGTEPIIINQGGKNTEIPSLPPVPANATGGIDVSTIFDGSIDKLESAYALQTYAAFG